MAEEEIEVHDNDLQKAIKSNGRFVDPWKTAALPSLIDFLRWRLKEKSERGVRGTWKDLYRLRNEASINFCTSTGGSVSWLSWVLFENSCSIK